MLSFHAYHVYDVSPLRKTGHFQSQMHILMLTRLRGVIQDCNKAYLILDKKLDALNGRGSSFRDSGRHTAHYDCLLVIAPDLSRSITFLIFPAMTIECS